MFNIAKDNIFLTRAQLTQEGVQSRDLNHYQLESGSGLDELGLEVHELAGYQVPVYSPEKVLADICYYRHKVGKSILLEGLKNYLDSPLRNIPKLVDILRARRVEKTMQPYLEALV